MIETRKQQIIDFIEKAREYSSMLYELLSPTTAENFDDLVTKNVMPLRIL